MVDLNSFTLSRRGMLAAMGSLGLALSGLTGCNSNENEPKNTNEIPSNNKSKYEEAKLRVAFMPNLGSASSLFSAVDQGCFEKVGLTVETQQFQAGPAEITALTSGDIDIAQIGHGAHSLCIQGKATIIAFDQLSQADAVVADKSKVPSAKDLKGKTVGVSSGTSSEIILNLVLRDAGLTRDDITTVEMDVSGMTTALLSGQIDAAATWSPNTVTIEQQLGDNYLVLGTNTDYKDEVAFPGSFVCTPDFVKKNSEIVARFGAAIDAAQRYRAKNIDKVAKLLADKLDLPEDTLTQSTGEGDWQGAVDDMGNIETLKGYYEAQQKIFLDTGAVTEKVPVENYVSFSTMEKAYKIYQQDF